MAAISIEERSRSDRTSHDAPPRREPSIFHPLGSEVGALFLVGFAYFTLAYLGLRLASLHPSVTLIWPPTGLAIAAILLRGSRIAPAIFIGALLVNQLTAGSILTSLAIASGNTLEAVVAGYLVRLWGEREQVFDTPTGVTKFAIISFAATMVSATIGVSSLTLAGYAEVNSFVSVWLTWWLGDLAGALVVAPVVVLWAKSGPALLTLPQITRTGLTYLAAAAVGLIAFSPLWQQTSLRDAMAFLVVVPLLWASLRQGPRDTATAALIISAFAVWGTLENGGPFAQPSLNDSFIVLLAFLVSAAVLSLVLSTDVTVRRRVENQQGQRASESPLGSQEATVSRLFDLSTEDLIDYLRCALAVMALFAFSLVPPQPNEDVDLVKLILSWYFLYSILILVVAKVWPTKPVWPFATHLIDIGASAFLMHLTDGSSSPFFVFFTFTLIAATLRWNWRGAMWTTLVVLLLFSALAARELNPADVPRIVMRSTYLIVFGLLLAYFGALRVQSRERFAKLGAWPAPASTAKSAPPLEVLLAHAAEVMTVPRVLCVWEETDNPERHFSLWSEGTLKCKTAWVDEPIERLVAPCLKNLVFMTRSAQSSVVTTHHGLRLCAAPAVIPPFREGYNIERVISAPFSRRFCRGRVFALDGPRFSDSQLPLVEIVGDRVGVELEHYFLQQVVELTVAERERSNLGHDLHDGILQNLTAATLQLSACSKTCEENARHDIEAIQQLLIAEQKRLREFVNGSQKKNGNENYALAITCERVLAELSTSWHCQAPLRVFPADAEVPAAVAEHLWLILAEAIANAAKHGGASCVMVDLERTTEALAIRISDNGSGFRGLTGSYTDEALIAEHIGPRFLCERVRGLRGHLMLSSSPAGARLQIRLPM